MSEMEKQNSEISEKVGAPEKKPFEQFSPEKQQQILDEVKKIKTQEELKKLGFPDQLAHLQKEVGGVLTDESAEKLLKDEEEGILDKASKVASDVVEKVEEVAQDAKDAFMEKTGLDKAEKTMSFFDKMSEKWDSISALWEKGDFWGILKLIFSADFLDFRSVKEKMESGIQKLANMLDLSEAAVSDWKKLLVKNEDFAKQLANVNVKKLCEITKKDNVDPLMELGISGASTQDVKNFLGQCFGTENFSKILNQVGMAASTAEDMTFSAFMAKIGK